MGESLPAWQTAELGEEWVESSPSPPTSPIEPQPLTHASIMTKRGSLRALGYSSAARSLPSPRAHSMGAETSGNARSPSNPFIRSASGMPSPPTSASSVTSSDEGNAAHVGADLGTCLIKDVEDEHGKAFPKNPFNLGTKSTKDMFSQLAIERLFEPPAEQDSTQHDSAEHVQDSDSSVRSEYVRSTSPEMSPPASAEGRRVSHPYAPANPSRLSKSVTPSSDSSFTTTVSSRVPTPALPSEFSETHQDNMFNDTREASSSLPDGISSEYSAHGLHTGEVEDLSSFVDSANFEFTFSAPIRSISSTHSVFEPSLEPLESGEPSHSTLPTGVTRTQSNQPQSSSLQEDKKFDTYNTYTRQFLSAIVDSIALEPSLSPPSAPSVRELHEWSPDPNQSAELSASDSHTTSTSGSDSGLPDPRSSKRLRLSPPSPRGPHGLKDWQAHGRALVDRIRITEAELSVTSGSRSGSHNSSTLSREISTSDDAPISNFDNIPPTPPLISPTGIPDEMRGHHRSNPSTASSTYLHRAENMMRKIKQRMISPSTSNAEQSPRVGGRGYISESSDQLVSTDAERPASKSMMRSAHIPQKSSQRHSAFEATQRGSGESSEDDRPLPIKKASLKAEDLDQNGSSPALIARATVPTSFIKRGGPQAQNAPAGRMTMIRPGDVRGVVPDRIGKMRFDQASMRWVRELQDSSLIKSNEGSESQGGSEESADIFAGLESVSDKSPGRQLEQADEILSEVILKPIESATDSSESESEGRMPSPIGAIPRDFQISPIRPQVTHASAPAAFSTPAPASGSNNPLRSALRNPNGQNSASAIKKRAAWHHDLTPAPLGRSESQSPSRSSSKRSVSFSDGRISATNTATHERGSKFASPEPMSSEVDPFSFKGHNDTNGSWLPTAKTKNNQGVLQSMADLTVNDIDDESPLKPSHGLNTDRRWRDDDHVENDDDSHFPSVISKDDESHFPSVRSFRSFRSRGNLGNATFLTECSFGVAHDRLVQLITDVQPFEPYWEQLRSIDLSNKGVDTLARLKEFLPVLDEANFNDNAIDYLSGIPSTVRTLHVAGNRITSLTSVNHLRNIQYLDISRNQLDSVSQLECLRHLRELKADHNVITDLSGIMSMDCLIKLSVAGNRIERVDLAVSKWQKLETLNLSNNCIVRVEDIHRLQSVATLNFDGNRIVSLDPLMPMTSVRTLRLSDNNINHIDLSLFPKVRTLFADNNILHTLIRSNTDSGSKLENLSLRNQRVGRFQLTCDDLFNVKRLYISGNRLDKNFFPQSPLYSLVYLEAAACTMSKWPTHLASRLPNLRILNINYNFFDNLDGLQGMSRLRKLMAVGCRLGGGTKGAVRGLKGLTSLEEVDMRMNPSTLSFYLPVLLPQKQKAVPVGLSNDVEQDAKWPVLDAQFRRQLPDDWYSKRLLYRGLVMASCPKISILDGLSVEEGEKRKAAQLLEIAASV